MRLVTEAVCLGYLGRATQPTLGAGADATTEVGTQVWLGQQRNLVIVRLQHLQDLQDVLLAQVAQVDGGRHDRISCEKRMLGLETLRENMAQLLSTLKTINVQRMMSSFISKTL